MDYNTGYNNDHGDILKAVFMLIARSEVVSYERIIVVEKVVMILTFNYGCPLIA